MPRINVKNAAVDERVVGANQTLLRSQMAELDLGNGYALPFRVGLGKRPPYQPGVYDIDPKSFQQSQYGDLQLGRFVDLVPWSATAPDTSKKA